MTLFCALGVCLLAACSTSIPSSRDGKGVIAQKIQNESQGLIKLVSFEKTDGQQIQFMGMNGYKMEYTAEIQFLDDCMWGSGGPFADGVSFEAVRGRPQGALDSFNPRYFGKQQVKKGQRVKVKGELAFEKTERGWRPSE